MTYFGDEKKFLLWSTERFEKYTLLADEYIAKER